MAQEQKNLVLIDWLSIATKELDEAGIQALIGMEEVNWQLIYGCYGFKQRLYYNGIGIHFDGRDDQGVLLEISGQGCRTFETLGKCGFERLFNFVTTGHGKINRLDVAYDDHTGVLDIAQIEKDAKEHRFVSRWRKVAGHWTDDEKSKGLTVEHGSQKSDMLLRIYDKAAERHCDPGEHWVRVELQMRDERAAAFLELDGSFGERLAGVLCNYLRYVVPDENDSNKWRWPMTDYWADFLGDCVRIQLYSTPGMEYNIDHLDHFVFQMAGNAIETALQIYGVEYFLEKLKEQKRLPNPKYKMLLDKILNLQAAFEKLSDDSDIPFESS